MKPILTLIFLLCISFLGQAQVDRTNFRGGLNLGLPIGDAAELSSISIGIDIYHHWGISRAIDLGVATGFTNAFGEEETFNANGVTVDVDFGNVQFVPLASSLRIFLSSNLKIGGDLGYAVGINSGNTGGLYYRPAIGLDLNQATELNFSYTGIALDGGTFSTVNVAILFLF